MKCTCYGYAIIVFFALSLTYSIPAQSADMTAYQIVKKSEDLLDQAKDSKADMLMILVNNKGQKRERTLNAFVKRYGNNKSKSIVFFSSPTDVKGTSFLVWTNEKKEDKQWLYLPALQRVRQISPSGKGESLWAQSSPSLIWEAKILMIIPTTLSKMKP